MIIYTLQPIVVKNKKLQSRKPGKLVRDVSAEHVIPQDQALQLREVSKGAWNHALQLVEAQVQAGQVEASGPVCRDGAIEEVVLEPQFL